MQLKDGTEVTDARLDRLIEFDDRSRSFNVANLLPEDKPPRSYTWSLNQILDQGQEGACVGFGVTHELIARPVRVEGLGYKFAREQVYWEAQKIDAWGGGSYPGAKPVYEGTSVLAGIKIAQKLGHYDSYYWAFNLEDLILAVGYKGPVVVGTNWYQSMTKPNEDGELEISGRVAGGHCYIINGVSIKKQQLRMTNSWGLEWGFNGSAFISFDTMRRLLAEQGEACVVHRETLS